MERVYHRAKKYYTNLPYHNFQHALIVLKAAHRITRTYKKAYDQKAVKHAILFHDAGYHENHKRRGYSTKEELSADIAMRELRNLGYSPQHIRKVKRLICSTMREKSARTVEEKIVRAADLASLKGSYKTFKENSRRLRQEYRQLTGKKLSVDEWKKSVTNTLGAYRRQRIKLTPSYYDKEGKSDFHEKLKLNLKRYGDDYA